ncbi:MAG: UDP-glucose 4-epimerase GalE [Patescibacteria group bacterium]
MNILVTGGAGFIGSHVVKILLDAGHQVSVLDNLSLGRRESVDLRAKLVVGDISDAQKAKEALMGTEAVIHMAGLIVVPDSVKDPIKYCTTNVLGTIKLLEVMRALNVKKIIFSSSACVYGTPESLPLKENAAVHPDNPYGASKAAIESYLQTYNAVYGFDSIILRYFNPYGPGEMHEPETHAIPCFVKSILAKKPIPLYWNGEQIRDFIYIDDLAKAHTGVLDLKGHQIFNIGTEKGVKVREVIDLLFKIVGYEVPIDDLGQRPGDVPANYASSAKLIKAIGWKANTSLEEGLTKTVEFFKTLTN